MKHIILPILLCVGLASCVTPPPPMTGKAPSHPPLPWENNHLEQRQAIASADVASISLPPKQTTVTLAWDYPLSFNIYTTDKLTDGGIAWTLVTNVTFTNLTVTIPSLKGQAYFTCTAVTIKDGLESDFSNIATNLLRIKNDD